MINDNMIIAVFIAGAGTASASVAHAATRWLFDRAKRGKVRLPRLEKAGSPSLDGLKNALSGLNGAYAAGGLAGAAMAALLTHGSA
ncbi:MAG: hypothetical protein K6T80_06625, partial [Firmicutes bacterium]|nr:hypothetical protein [Bacillota bacterium]